MISGQVNKVDFNSQRVGVATNHNRGETLCQSQFSAVANLAASTSVLTTPSLLRISLETQLANYTDCIVLCHRRWKGQLHHGVSILAYFHKHFITSTAVPELHSLSSSVVGMVWPLLLIAVLTLVFFFLLSRGPKIHRHGARLKYVNTPIICCVSRLTFIIELPLTVCLFSAMLSDFYSLVMYSLIGLFNSRNILVMRRTRFLCPRCLRVS